jgi:chromosome segregation ATPase
LALENNDRLKNECECLKSDLSKAEEEKKKANLDSEELNDKKVSLGDFFYFYNS